MKLLNYLFFSLFLCLSLILPAQQDITFYNLNQVPQRIHYVNPAMIPLYRVNIGLPLISSIYLNASNSAFKYNDLIKEDFYLDINNVVPLLKKNNYFTAAAMTDLFSFGFGNQNQYFSFNASEKVTLRIRYPKDAVVFIRDGKQKLVEKQEITIIPGVDFDRYREYGMGYAKKINKKLTLGGRLKYLNGIKNIRTSNSSIHFTVEPDYNGITSRSDILIHTAGIDTTGAGSEDLLLDKVRGRGAAGDIGLVYQLNEQLTFSASIIDIGAIRWKTNVTNYTNNQQVQFEYSGTSLNSAEKDKKLEKVIDSLGHLLDVTVTDTRYTSWLPVQSYLGMNYHLNKNHHIAFVFHNQLANKLIHPAIGLSYNLTPKKWCSFAVSYSILNKSYDNLGLGFVFNLGPVQWYLATDNLRGGFNYQKTKNIHVHTGINLVLGKKRSDNKGNQNTWCPAVNNSGPQK